MSDKKKVTGYVSEVGTNVIGDKHGHTEGTMFIVINGQKISLDQQITVEY